MSDICSVRLNSSLCEWKNGCIVFIEFVPEKGGQFYTMGESVVGMPTECC